MENKTLEQLLRKWSPILDALKVTDDKIKKIMVEYAEYCQSPDDKIKKIMVEYSDYQSSENDIAQNFIGQNLLPVSLKILSQLNIKDKNVVLKKDKIGFEDIPTKNFSISINKNELISMKEGNCGFGVFGGFQVVQQLESEIVQLLVNNINKELETKENLYISSLVQSISIISTEKYGPRLMLKSIFYID